jgi:hypothetical protein
MDAVYMPVSDEGYRFIIFTSDDLSGWVERHALQTLDSRSVARCLFEISSVDMGCRKGLFSTMISKTWTSPVIYPWYYGQIASLFDVPPATLLFICCMDVISWHVLDWEEVQDREQLLMARVKQLDEYTITETRAASELERPRCGNKAYFDNVKWLRSEHQQLRLGDLVQTG